MTLEQLLQNINTPGWDWPENDFCWLASKSGLHRKEEDGACTSIFFIHGGRIREQARLPYGGHDVEEFIEAIRKRAASLDNPVVRWESDTGNGEAGLWVEGTRLPREDDLMRLEDAREKQRKEDGRTLAEIASRRASNS